jgi:hypothetical protein
MGGSNDDHFGYIGYFAFHFPADEFEEKTADPPYEPVPTARQLLAQDHILDIPPR